MSIKLEFADDFSPTDGRKNPLYAEVAAALRKNPGRWAKWPEPTSQNRARSLATTINAGRIPVLAEGFRASAKRGQLHVCFIGDAS